MKNRKLFAQKQADDLILWLLKTLITISLLLVVGLQTFSRLFIFFGYEINKEYISRNLCENRNKPACCCHGKCYLRKKLNQDQNQQQSPGKTAKQESDIQLFLNSNDGFAFDHPVSRVTQNGVYQITPSRDFSALYFQPPRA